ncbi:hypothetical protein [uncultured Cohaesibacter sp.]|uniref:HPr kinase/phosphorylase n=1 Tax=uncultured Cohaesibacter sp. TaxID=1002546 RepID=UPI00292FA48A|nr:hypothetical protein [uncultured Cohaesibacter sp.]
MPDHFEPDIDETGSGPIFKLPSGIDPDLETCVMHASAIVMDQFGLLLRGVSGSGKSLLQRYLRERATTEGLYSALVSDDYVKLVRLPDNGAEGMQEATAPPLLGFAPTATYGLQEIRGIGVTSVGQDECLRYAVMHLLVDLTPSGQIRRMPAREQCHTSLMGHLIPTLDVPQRSVIEASDLIFGLLSTWKDLS